MAFLPCHVPRRIKRQAIGLACLGALAWAPASDAEPIPAAAATCQQRLYLTLDTGHMGVAELIAQVRREKAVRATFFAANERTQEGDGS